ncbi:hypothetical protein [Thermovenabulum gondwanense]|uniref:Uncharacterized protein n=1 Tax=Thermovenabulum gondwanense TaxID=520767 RepID=A0A162MUK3_9FIRM|nr:hypothetical protein [Thermovenabulum gondwanense]KYO67378.1 hypothetical protein ATZ99_06640 [Thermovenabulum gondwanense]
MTDKDRERRLGHIEKPEDAKFKKKIDDELEDELADDTMYGEIMSSLMGWISPEQQLRRANNLVEISKELDEQKEKEKNKKDKK